MASQEGTSQNQTVTADTDERLATHRIGKTLAKFEECSNFLDLVRKADAEYLLNLGELRTLFAPNNEAVTELSGDLADLVNRHLVPGALESFDLRRVKTVRNFAGEEVRVEEQNGIFRIGRAAIVRSDIACTNGVIHVIDQLIS